jgi:polar amino acid transport system substrate-binding protein
MKRWLVRAGFLILLSMTMIATGCQLTRKSLVVGTSADYAPFEYLDENGDFRGFDIELMQEIGMRMGYSIAWQDIPFDGLLEALQNDEIDVVIAAMSATPDREAYVDFTDPYFIGADAIIVVEGAAITINKNEDMAGYRVGVQTGTIQEAWIDDNIEADVFRYERTEQAIVALKEGHIDLVAMDYYAAQAFKDMGDIEIALKTQLSGERMAIAVNDGNTALQEKIDAAIDDLQAEGFIESLAIKYLVGE